jgi:WD40 repeat protein
VYENPINFKVYFVDCNVGLRDTYSPSEYTLGVKTTKKSANDLFLAMGSFDQTVHLMNIKTCKLIAQLDCSNASINCVKTVIIYFYLKRVFKETSPHGCLE